MTSENALQNKGKLTIFRVIFRLSLEILTSGGCLLKVALKILRAFDDRSQNARLFMILFVRNFRRVCSQFWPSVRHSV